MRETLDFSNRYRMKGVSELKRKGKRLLRMSPHELAVRSAELGWGFRERLFARLGGSFGEELDSTTAQALLEEAWSLPFYFRKPVGIAEAPQQSFATFFPGRKKAILEKAEAICAGTRRLNGQDVTFLGEDLDWHLDWETRDHFPVKFYRDIPTLSSPRRADLKRVWENNRHQFLTTLGQAYFLTRRQRYSECATRLLDSWIQANPPYQGVNWKEGLEVGLRLLSWVWTLQLLQDAPGLRGLACRRLLTCLSLQRDYLERHLSLYSSPNTHLLGEALALFVVGLMFPELGNSDRTVARAMRILETELKKQVEEDGSHREKSSYYHCYALDMYLLATVLGKQRGIQFSPSWEKRIQKMAEFLLAILRPDGSLARFGDDDGGRTLRLNHEDYYHPRPLLALAAVMFERGDFKFAAGELPEEVWWILGSEGARQYLELPTRKPAHGVVHFPNAELSVLRTGWSSDALWLSCQSQPIDRWTPGHSHAALLSFELFADEKPLIVDPGTYTYQTGSLWREHFRSMQAHNLVQINHMECLVPAGPFGWKIPQGLEAIPAATPLPNRLRLGYRAAYANRCGMQHIRTIVVESPRVVSIRDTLEGTGRHWVVFWLHFAPGSRVRMKGNSTFTVLVHGTILNLVLQGFASFRWRVWEGSENPMGGWVSPRFGCKVPAAALCIEESINFPSERKMELMIEPESPLDVPSDQGVTVINPGLVQGKE